MTAFGEPPVQRAIFQQYDSTVPDYALVQVVSSQGQANIIRKVKLAINEPLVQGDVVTIADEGFAYPTWVLIAKYHSPLTVAPAPATLDGVVAILRSYGMCQ